MSTLAQPEGVEFKVSFSRLRVVRAAALCSLLSILLPWYGVIIHDFRQQDRVYLFVPVLFFPLWLPYAWVIWRLRLAADVRTVKKALAVALGCGSCNFILFAFLLGMTSFDVDRRSAFAYALLALSQIALVASGVTTYYSMKRAPGDLRILATRLWVPVVGIAYAAILIPYLVFVRERAPDPEYGVSSLRTIVAAQVLYAQHHPDRGFATSLAELGPEPGEELIDPVLASGQRSGYLIILTAGPRDSRGRISHYSVIARPEKFGQDGKYSFFTDESGVQHFTMEDRAPTAQDPATR
jgi:hypothetical protein